MSYQSKIWKQIYSLTTTAALIGSSTAFAQAPNNSLMKQNQLQKSRLSRKALATTTTTQTKPTELEKKWSGSLGMVMQGKRYDAKTAQKTTTVFSVSANINYLPVPVLRFNFSPRFDYTNGYIQTTTQTDGSKSSWGVTHAGVDFIPASFITASLGALEQSTMHSEIILDATFPAVALNLTTPTDADFVLGGNAESAIVTSSSLSTEKKDFEKTPTFQSAGLNFKAQNMVVEGSLKAGAFAFNDLPSAVATSAGNVGNTTIQIGTAPKNFVYQYKGHFASAHTKINFTKYFGVGVRGHWIQNIEAPKDLNQGTIGKVFIDADLSENFRMGPFYDYFRIEPDATVASLNDDRYNTNRVGYRAGLYFQFQKSAKISVSGGERDVLYINTPQERERTWNLRLETLNVDI